MCTHAQKVTWLGLWRAEPLQLKMLVQSVYDVLRRVGPGRVSILPTQPDVGRAVLLLPP